MRLTSRSLQVAIFLLANLAVAREYGPSVGGRLADFTLQDQDGKLRDLQSLLGAKGAVILFFRSADW